MDLEDSITQTQIEPIEDEVLPCRRAEGMSNEPPDEEHWGKLICHTDEEETTNSDTCTIAVLYPNIIYLKRKESNVSKPGALNEIMLGRSSSCEVVINDKRISSQHCRLYCIPSVAGEGEHIRTLGVFIEDMSSNGTWVNTYTHLSKRKGKQSKRQLYSGDELSLLNPMRRGKKENIAQFQTSKAGNRGSRRIASGIDAVSAGASSVSGSDGGGLGCSCTRFTFVASSRLNSFCAPPSHDFQGAKENAESAGTCNNVYAENKPMNNNNCIYGPSIFDFYTILDVIGSGTSGVVRLGKHKETGREVAVKVIQTRRFQLAPGLSPSEIAAEAEMLRGITHQNIVKLEDVFMDASNVYIILELVRGGDLFDRIVNRGCYQESTARELMWILLIAVKYLHDKDIVHRDLKPENILLISPTNDVDIKITDFGLAKRTNQDGLKTFCGTPQYFAPEVLLRKNTICGIGRYGKEADMWSLGVIFYIVLSGTHPFHEHSLFDQIQGAKYSFDGPEWQLISREAKELVQCLLCTNPRSRLTVSQALQHPFFKSLTMTSNNTISPNDDHSHSCSHDNGVSHTSSSPMKASIPLSTNARIYNTTANGGVLGGQCAPMFNASLQIQATGQLPLVNGGGYGFIVPPVTAVRGDVIQDDDISEYSSDDTASKVPPKKRRRQRPRKCNAKSTPTKAAIKQKRFDLTKLRRTGGGSAKALCILNKASSTATATATVTTTAMATAMAGSVQSENNKKPVMGGYQTTLKSFLNPQITKSIV